MSNKNEELKTAMDNIVAAEEDLIWVVVLLAGLLFVLVNVT